MTTAPIAVVGGGVIGLTTALALRLAGYDVVIYANSFAPTAIAAHDNPDPRFASLHAAASVIPHTVRSSRVQQWLKVSHAVFSALAFPATNGVRTQRHYEIFENPAPPPPYRSSLQDYTYFEPSDAPNLSRSNDTPIDRWGWHFNTLFCEVPTYLTYLAQLIEYLQVPVVVPTGSISLDSLVGGDHKYIINCCGLGAYDFLKTEHTDTADGEIFQPIHDRYPAKVVRGHWIRVRMGRGLVLPNVGLFSYNYTPVEPIYSAGRGVAADVYCYPRSDVWILGGSRQLRIGSSDWVAGDNDHLLLPTLGGSQVEIPEPILTLNSDIIESATDGKVSLKSLLARQPDAFYAGIGYRFERNHPSEGVRLEASRVAGCSSEHILIHNYGHGGAGYTLSWGCAADVVNTVGQLEQISGAAGRNTRIDLKWSASVGILASALSLAKGQES